MDDDSGRAEAMMAGRGQPPSTRRRHASAAPARASTE
jgi:hypothetical protein